ncbi:uncharacterized protein [Magallana gigas]|uniref:uncharacterized protein n=1 Tax=Magallana gigas TaxID=29159 RepID=UPI00333FA769
MEELFPSARPDYSALRRPFDESDRDFLHQESSNLGRFIEVKCPFSALSSVVKAAKDLKNFFSFLDVKGDSLCMKTSHPYYHQIQGQLHICNKTCCDLIVWTTVDCVVIRIVKDPEWTVNIANLVDIYFNTFIPALLDN